MGETDTELNIREAELSDCDAIAKVYNEAMRTGRSTMDTRPFAGARFAAYIDTARRERILVGEIEGQPVGWGIVKRYSDRPGYRYACETSVYVTAAYQGLGYGTQVLRAVIDTAQALGYHHLVAKILAVNDESVRFHERLGFEVVGRQEAIGFLKGEWQDIVIMQLVLNDSEPSSTSETTGGDSSRGPGPG